MNENVDENLPTPENFEFPFTPYDIQKSFMEKLYTTIEEKKFGIFESPTGTGKSLSIICGAIKWLKDHNQFVCEQYNKKIEKLELEKEKIGSESSDWLSVQSKEIEISRMLDKLKIERNKIIEYDKKIEDLKKKGTEYKKKKFPPKNASKDELEQSEEKQLEESELLLEETDLPPGEESLSDEENEDNLYHPTEIYICSRTHSQLSQFIGEIIKSPFGKDIRVVSLASRQNYCINPEVTKLKSMALINERCLDMQKKTSKPSKTDSDGKVIKRQKSSCKCPYYNQTNIEQLRDLSLLEIQNIEDLVTAGKELKACPYYAARKASEDAEIVLIPYNTLLHKATREANNITLKNNVIIIDEAHNLLEALAQMHGSEMGYIHAYYGLNQLKCYKQRFNTQFSAKNLLAINQLIFVVERIFQFLDKTCKEESTEIFKLESFVLTVGIDNYNMFRLVNFCKDSRIAQKVRNYSVKYPIQDEIENKPTKKGIKDFLQSIENKKKIVEETKPKEKNDVPIPNNPLLAIISFLESLTYSNEDGRILFVKNPQKINSKLQFLLLNPSTHFSDIVKEARSVIVAGGTMKPISEFRDRLFISAGVDPNRILEFSCDHIVPPENILPIILTKGLKNERLLFNFEHRTSMGEILMETLKEVCRIVRGGVVVFFPSYKYENWFWEKVKNVTFGRPVFREPQSSALVESVLEKYAETIRKSSKKSAMMFSVVGGKLSEGLNFSDDLGRCVVVVGLPYANVTAADLKEKMNYLDKNEGFGAGKKFYENTCMKAVNQCIGRAVRHKNDYATVLLLDERYDRLGTKNSLPNWIKRSLETATSKEAFRRIGKFFENR